MKANPLAYKDALNEIISIQDTYITSNTQDNAAVSLMIKWREKVMEYAIRLRNEELKAEKASLSIKTDCNKKIEQANQKYEAIINDLKTTFQNNDEATKLKEENARNNKENIKLKDEIAKLKEENLKLKRIVSECESKESQYSNLRDVIADYEKKETQLKQTISESETLCAQNKKQISEMEKKINQYQNNESKTAEEYRMLIQKQEQKYRQLNDTYTAAEETNGNENGRLNAKIKQQTEEICLLKKEREEINSCLKNEVETIKSLNENSHRTHEKEKSRLEGTITSLTETKIACEKTIERHQSEIKLLKDRLMKEKEEIKARYEKEISELKKQAECNAIEGTSKYQKECVKITKENMKLLNLNKQLNDECQKLKAEIENKDDNIKKLAASFIPERVKTRYEELSKSKERITKDSEKKKSEEKAKPKPILKEGLEKAQTVDGGSVMNDENIDTEIYRTMSKDTEVVHKSHRLMSKLKGLESLAKDLLLEDI